jgi:hypothetical protein
MILRSWSKHGDEIINLEGFTRLEEHGDWKLGQRLSYTERVTPNLNAEANL